jgi:urease gamma subunit
MGAALPIRKFIHGEVFDPEALESMGAALVGACRALGLKMKDDQATRLLAARIIEAARNGERNAERLRAIALKDIPQLPSE